MSRLRSPKLPEHVSRADMRTGAFQPRLRSALSAAAMALLLVGCASEQPLDRTQMGSDLIAAFRSAPPEPRAPSVVFDAAPIAPQATQAGALYRSFRIALTGDALSAAEAAALASIGRPAALAPVRSVLLSVRPAVEGRAYPELPLALLGVGGDGAARVFARWSHLLPPARDDLRITLDWLARTSSADMAESRRAADLAARLGGMTVSPGSEGPRWMAAPLSDASAAALAQATDGALAELYSAPAAIAPTSAPAAALPAMTLRLGDPAGENLQIVLEQEAARSRMERLLSRSELTLDSASPSLGFTTTSGASLLRSARYLRLQDPRGADPTLAEILPENAQSAGFAGLLAAGAPLAAPELASQCSAMRAFLNDAAALSGIDRVAAMVETLRESGREAALFRSPACLPPTDRPLACGAGLLSCGESRPGLDERTAMKALADYMRWPTRSRRETLAALLPDRISVSKLGLARGGRDGDTQPLRRRMTRDALLDALAEARLNRYGEAARNPSDPDWWMANFTRRPALRRVLTVYAAFEEGRFDDLGFVEARVDDDALADNRSWAHAQLGPLIAPCDRTESPPFGAGLVMRARQPLGDCARFDDFAL